MKKIAVIGAGPSGISVLATFSHLFKKNPLLSENYKISCYEKQSDIGGLWNVTWRTGLDEYGNPLHQSMYYDLWINVAKEIQECWDYSYWEHFKEKSIGSFAPRSVVKDYLRGRCERFNLYQFISLNSNVTSVVFDKKTEQFSVTDHNEVTKECQTKHYHYCIVANGHFSKPNMPYVNGIDSFPGRIIHSKDLRFSQQFENQTVLLIGSGLSAEDIAMQCLKYGSKKIYISFNKPNKLSWNTSTIENVADVTRIEGNNVTLGNGIILLNIDSIIYCTGYLYDFPFLDTSLRIKTSKHNLFFPDDLYKGSVYINNSNLFYSGMENQLFSFRMFDINAFFIADTILRKIKLPISLDDMVKDIEKCKALEHTAKGIKHLLDIQYNYIMDKIDVIESVNFDKKPWVNLRQQFLRLLVEKDNDVLSYRESAYTSVVSGEPGQPLPKKWLDSRERDLNEFLSLFK